MQVAKFQVKKLDFTTRPISLPNIRTAAKKLEQLFGTKPGKQVKGIANLESVCSDILDGKPVSIAQMQKAATGLGKTSLQNLSQKGGLVKSPDGIFKALFMNSAQPHARLVEYGHDNLKNTDFKMLLQNVFLPTFQKQVETHDYASALKLIQSTQKQLASLKGESKTTINTLHQAFDGLKILLGTQIQEAKNELLRGIISNETVSLFLKNPETQKLGGFLTSYIESARKGEWKNAMAAIKPALSELENLDNKETPYKFLLLILKGHLKATISVIGFLQKGKIPDTSEQKQTKSKRLLGLQTFERQGFKQSKSHPSSKKPELFISENISKFSDTNIKQKKYVIQALQDPKSLSYVLSDNKLLSDLPLQTVGTCLQHAMECVNRKENFDPQIILSFLTQSDETQSLLDNVSPKVLATFIGSLEQPESFSPVLGKMGNPGNQMDFCCKLVTQGSRTNTLELLTPFLFSLRFDDTTFAKKLVEQCAPDVCETLLCGLRTHEININKKIQTLFREDNLAAKLENKITPKLFDEFVNDVVIPFFKNLKKSGGLNNLEVDPNRNKSGFKDAQSNLLEVVAPFMKTITNTKPLHKSLIPLQKLIKRILNDSNKGTNKDYRNFVCANTIFLRLLNPKIVSLGKELDIPVKSLVYITKLLQNICNFATDAKEEKLTFSMNFTKSQFEPIENFYDAIHHVETKK